MTESLMGYDAKIIEELAPLTRPIGDATPHPDNVRKHKIEAIAQSLEHHGQRAPIIVQQSTGYIVKGNGTHAAAQLLGWTELAMSFQEMTDQEAITFLFEDNRTSDVSAYHKEKLKAGLEALAQSPGWLEMAGYTPEELADLEEELGGTTVLAAQESEASFATKDGEQIKHERAALPGEKMREVPLVLTIADHAMFVSRVQILQKRFGTSGSIMTIVEAVKRQAEAEAAEGPATGAALSDETVYAIKREVVKEVRDYFLALGDRNFSATSIAAYLETVVPYRNDPQPVAEGQQTLFPDEPGTALPNQVDDVPAV